MQRENTELLSMLENGRNGDQQMEEVESFANGSEETLSPLSSINETTMSLQTNVCGIITGCSPTETKNTIIFNYDGCDKHYSRLGRHRFGAMHPWLVGFSVLVYWVFVSLIPVYNKYFFQRSLFPYPVATAAIQLGIVSFLCAVINIVQRRICFSDHSYDARDNIADSRATVGGNTCEQSWILGPHFWWKMKWCFPIGVLFGVKYSVSNLGLHLVSAPTHLLLQSTDLVWAVLGAWSINGERSSVAEMVCLLGCIAGSILLSWQLLYDNEGSSLTEPFYAIAINVTSPILLGLCLATLRLACTELMRPDNRVGGTVSAIELTSIKLIISSMIGLVMACFLEGGVNDDVNDNLTISWWVAFVGLPTSTQSGVICGAFFVSIFQVNCTFLTFLTSAVALGIVGQVKIIPQWIVASIFGVGASSRPAGMISLMGAILIMSSAAGFALSNLMTADATTVNAFNGKSECKEERLAEHCCNNENKTDAGTWATLPDERTSLLIETVGSSNNVH